MPDFTKLTQDELATRQKLLESEIADNEAEIRVTQAELNEVYAEQDRRRT